MASPASIAAGLEAARLNDTTVCFARTSRDRRPFTETERPRMSLDECAVYAACAVATLIMVGIIAAEYAKGGPL